MQCDACWQNINTWGPETEVRCWEQFISHQFFKRKICNKILLGNINYKSVPLHDLATFSIHSNCNTSTGKQRYPQVRRSKILFCLNCQCLQRGMKNALCNYFSLWEIFSVAMSQEPCVLKIISGGGTSKECEDLWWCIRTSSSVLGCVLKGLLTVFSKIGKIEVT